MLDVSPPHIIEPLVNWLESVQLPSGVIPHPPDGLYNYPHQPWWENPDDNRVLVIAALLKRRGVKAPGFYKRVKAYYDSIPEKKLDSFYSYPIFAYASIFETDDKGELVEQIPGILEEHAGHYPLFSRYWFYAMEYCPKAVIQQEARCFIDGIQADGGLKDLYPELPWWRPIFTVDGLMLIKRYLQE